MSSTTSKPSNPKDVLAGAKAPLHLWPVTATAAGSIGLLNGALKYGRLNWRQSGASASVYISAAKRHIDLWFEGEEVDADDGVPHLYAAISCLAILIDAKATGVLIDDRQFNGEGAAQFLGEMALHVSRLQALHEGRAPVHYTIQSEATHHGE